MNNRRYMTEATAKKVYPTYQTFNQVYSTGEPTKVFSWELLRKDGESEKRYKTILESIEDSYFEVDLSGDMTFFNKALCRMTGYSPAELRGMNYMDYTEPATAKRMYEIFNSWMKNPRDIE